MTTRTLASLALSFALALELSGCSSAPPTGSGTTGAAASSASSTASGSSTGGAGTSSGTSGGTTGAPLPDGGPDAGPPPACGSIGAGCGEGALQCCGNLLCSGGSCTTPTPTCAGYGQPCGGGVNCCAPPAGPVLACTPLDGGIQVCLAGQSGDACGPSAPCASPAVCTAGVCALPNTGNACVGGKPCFAGDQCTNDLSFISPEGRDEGTGADPCFPSGLICVGFTTAQGTLGLCVQPTVIPTADDQPAPFDESICNSGVSTCAAFSFGANRTAPVCGSYWGAQYFVDGIYGLSPSDRCLPSCTTADDCDSLNADCINGACTPNWCYADGYSTLLDGGRGPLWSDAITPVQEQQGGGALSDDAGVLFAPCASGSPNMYCLPQYEQGTNAAAGHCIRVGTPDAGGLGALCDSRGYRNDPAGLCAAGTVCEKGSCVPWCDVASPASIACPAGTACETFTGHIGLSSGATGTHHSIGACLETCNPYLGASGNTCHAFATDAGSPPTVCRLAGVDSDYLPAPGYCVAGVDVPLAVGQPCSPFGWLDPCASGAQCTQVADGGSGYACAQLCDPIPSAQGDISPACAAPTTCQPLACQTSTTGLCKHEGVCQ